MPWKLRKAPKKELYWVVNKETGHKHSKEPLPKATAEAQMKALYATEGGGTHRENVADKLKLEGSQSIADLSKASGVSAATLQEVYNRGIGAYKTNPTSVRMKGSFKKGINAPMSQKLSKEQWAMARVYSFLDGNKKHDQDLKGGVTITKPAFIAEHKKLIKILKKKNPAALNAEAADQSKELAKVMRGGNIFTRIDLLKKEMNLKYKISPRHASYSTLERLLAETPYADYAEGKIIAAQRMHSFRPPNSVLEDAYIDQIRRDFEKEIGVVRMPNYTALSIQKRTLPLASYIKDEKLVKEMLSRKILEDMPLAYGRAGKYRDVVNERRPAAPSERSRTLDTGAEDITAGSRMKGGNREMQYRVLQERLRTISEAIRRLELLEDQYFELSQQEGYDGPLWEEVRESQFLQRAYEERSNIQMELLELEHPNLRGGALRLDDAELRAIPVAEDIWMEALDQADGEALVARWNELRAADMAALDRIIAQQRVEDERVLRGNRRQARNREADKLSEKHQRKNKKLKTYKKKVTFRGRGVGDSVVVGLPKALLQQMAKESYAPIPAPIVGDFRLIQSTPTLKFYEKGGTIVVAIRGTVISDANDLKADAMGELGRIRYSERYRIDKEEMQRMKAAHPNAHFVAVGHSLGGAILDLFLRDGFVASGLSYNGYPEPHERAGNPLHHRIYHKEDYLYKLFANKIPNIEVRTTQEPFWKYLMRGVLPFGVGKVAFNLDSHLLGRFEGGRAAY